jgi:DnaJ-class molecular chaperone
MKPMMVALEVTLDEIYTGDLIKRNLPRMRLCKDCKGYSIQRQMKIERDANRELIAKHVRLVGAKK